MQQPTPIEPNVREKKYLHLWPLTIAFVLSLSMLALFPHKVKAAFDCNDVTEIPVVECQALVALYNSTDGPNWVRQDNWLVTTTLCSWYGVTCTTTTAPRRVTHIELTFNQLSGSIPAEIGNLTNLEVLDLFENQLNSLPAEIGNLTNLRYLMLFYNQLSSVPAEIGNLTNLQVLGLAVNQLSSFPVEILNLTNLQQLLLNNNQLSSVPAEIGNLTSLQYLALYNNQLSIIPAEIGNLTNLEYLILSSNQLSSVPAEIGKLTNLVSLGLDSNQLSNVPAEIGNLTSLQNLDLSSNQLSSIPAEIGNLTNLQELYLYSNQLSSVPAEIGNLTNLRVLYLYGNRLSNVPAEIGNLTSLEFLNISFNPSLAGPLPATFVQLTALQEFGFDNTNLCEPGDAAFQSWLASISALSGTGVTCSGSPPPPSSSLHLSLFTNEVAAGGVTLYWETETEADNLGFNIYRLAVNDTPATKVNTTFIAALGNAESGATYQILDRPGTGHFVYLIKNVDQQGVEHLRGQVEVEAQGYVFFIPALFAP